MSKNNFIDNKEEDFSNQFVREFLEGDETEIPNINPDDINIDKELENIEREDDRENDIDIIYPIDMGGEKEDNEIYTKVEEEKTDILKIEKDESDNIYLNDDFNNEGEYINDINNDINNNFNNEDEYISNINNNDSDNNELDNDKLFNLNNKNEDESNSQDLFDLDTEGEKSNNNNNKNNSFLSKLPKVQELKDKKEQLEKKVHGKKNLKILIAMTTTFVIISGFILRDITKTFLIQDTSTPSTNETTQDVSINNNKDDLSLGSLLPPQSNNDESSSKKIQDAENKKKQSDLDLLIQSDIIISDNFVNIQLDTKKYNQKLLIYNTFKSAIDKKISKIDEVKKLLTSDIVIKDSNNSEMINILNQRLKNQEDMFNLINEYLDTDKGVTAISDIVNQYVKTDESLKISQNEEFLKLLNIKGIKYSKDVNGNIIIE